MRKSRPSRAASSRPTPPTGNINVSVRAAAPRSVRAVAGAATATGSMSGPFSGPARSILRGELDRIGLATLLTMVEMERRSGLLVMSRPRQLGRLHIRDGHIIRAEVEGLRRQNGEEAVYQMLTWPDGQFEMWHTEVEGRDEIRHRTTYLLMEGMRRLDEALQGLQGLSDGQGGDRDGSDAVSPGPDADHLLVL